MSVKMPQDQGKTSLVQGPQSAVLMAQRNQRESSEFLPVISRQHNNINLGTVRFVGQLATSVTSIQNGQTFSIGKRKAIAIKPQRNNDQSTLSDVFRNSESLSWGSLLNFTSEAIVVKLGRLKIGWAGPGSVSPSEKVVEDVLTVLSYMPPAVVSPEIEVDAEDGYVTLIWRNSTTLHMFALVFCGNGSVIGVAPTQYDRAPWQIQTSDEIKVVAQLEVESTLGHFSL